MIEFIERLTALDVLLMLLWLGAIAYGLHTGAVRQLFMIGSMLVGAVLGSALASPLSVWTGPISGVGQRGILPFTFTVLVVLFALIIYIVIVRTYPQTRLTRTRGLDSVAGAVVGFVTGLVGITEIAAIMDLLTRGQWAVLDSVRASIAGQVQTGPLFRLVANTFPFVKDGIALLIPQT